jgi:hypothetical protein
MRSGLPCSGFHYYARVAVALHAPKKYKPYDISNIGCGMRATLDAIKVETLAKVLQGMYPRVETRIGLAQHHGRSYSQSEHHQLQCGNQCVGKRTRVATRIGLAQHGYRSRSERHLRLLYEQATIWKRE